MSPRATLEIASIASGGDGVGRLDGLAVFVPRSAPGDIVDVEYTVRGRLGRGRIVELVRPSSERVQPPCAHYVADRCGGCQVQHMSYGSQLASKGDIVADALRRIGRRQVGAPPVAAMAEPWRYRRKLTLALRRRGDGWLAGLHPYDAPGRVFEVEDCPITDARVLDIWREILAEGAKLPDVPALRGAVRLLDQRTDGGLSRAAFVLEGGRKWPAAASFFGALPRLAALWWQPEGGERRLLHDRRSEAEPGASFVQVNPVMASELRDHVRELVLARSPRTVVDAYAGGGDHAVALAAEGVAVTAVELDAEAAAWAASRLAAPSRAIRARVEEVLGDLLPADAVILNPPRAGVDARVAAQLVANPPAALVYVSCDPATLARDVARLPGFRVEGLRSFDMFPQTSHVETVCELVPEAV